MPRTVPHQSYPQPTADQRAIAAIRLDHALAEGDLRKVCDFAWVFPDIERVVRQVLPGLQGASDVERKRECTFIRSLLPEHPAPTCHDER
jgi:hypothetical protein